MDEQDRIISRIVEFAREKMQSYGRASHDFQHVWRVWKMAERIGEAEMEKGRDIDMLVVSASALLHDVIDPKLADPEESKAELAEFLSGLGLSGARIRNIMGIIENLSFRKMMQGHSWPTREFDIVSDADKLDAMGAIGIARVFAYSGEAGRPFYDGSEQASPEFDIRSYEKPSTAIGHFYEKILRLREMMRTEEGKRIAEHRHQFLEIFLDEFLKEMKAED